MNYECEVKWEASSGNKNMFVYKTLLQKDAVS